MRFRELRRLLQSIVIASLPAACTDGTPIDAGECYRTMAKTFDVTSSPSDPPLELRIESCRVDVDACRDLCVMLMNRASLPTPETCSVTFDGTDATVHTTYTEFTNKPGCASEGRRPAGLVDAGPIDAPDEVARWLAHAAWLEAASIPAFVYLARELDLRHAPRVLVRLALAAARDEIRHARLMTELAIARGARVPAVEVPSPRERSLQELAIENAVEGCVRETWGAVVARWQAHRAQTAELRAIYRGIADDEARHAALGWMIDAWVRPQLAPTARNRVDAHREAAVRDLFAAPHTAGLPLIGLPGAPEIPGLLDRTTRALWSAKSL